MRSERKQLQRPACAPPAGAPARSVRTLASLVLLTAMAASLAGCATGGVAAPTVQLLSQTHYAATQTVDVLGALPSTPFERIAQLQLNDPTGVATQSQLVAQLSDTARNLGANALVVESVSHSGGGDVAFNPSGGQMQGTNAGGSIAVTALAIRYTH